MWPSPAWTPGRARFGAVGLSVDLAVCLQVCSAGFLSRVTAVLRRVIIQGTFIWPVPGQPVALSSPACSTCLVSGHFLIFIQTQIICRVRAIA